MSNTNTNTIDNSDEIILGSGDLYIVEFSGAIPEDATIEADSNRAGNIKSGATLEYSADSQTVQDDKGRVKKTIITKETVTFKTGLITWVPQYIQALIQTARIDETTKKGHRLFRLGGLSNLNKSVICGGSSIPATMAGSCGLPLPVRIRVPFPWLSSPKTRLPLIPRLPPTLWTRTVRWSFWMTSW